MTCGMTYYELETRVTDRCIPDKRIKRTNLNHKEFIGLIDYSNITAQLIWSCHEINI